MPPDPITQPADLTSEIKEIIVTADQIQQRVIELGVQISHDYAGKNPILVGVLKGVVFFMADLLRAITIPTELDFLSITHYASTPQQRGSVRLVKDLESPIQGRHILFIEDVIDTGLTLNYLLQTLRARSPESLEVCVLFNKNRTRLIDIPLKYKGFDLPDRFVVGYGLDYQEKYRNLPYIGLLKPHIFQNQIK